MEDKPNILLITVDSLRPDHLGYFGYDIQTSPNIDALARRGKDYRSALSHGGGTSEAFPTILNGVLPPVDIKQCDLGLRRGASVVKRLKEKGYTTAAFNSNPYLSRFFGYADDFDLFFHNLKGVKERRHTVTDGGIYPLLKLITGNPPIIQGQELVHQFKTWLATVRAPFFAWIHFMDAHMPYLPPSDFVRMITPKPANRLYMVYLYRKMYESNRKVYQSLDPSRSTLTAEELRKIIEYYDAGVRYVDSCVGELLDILQDKVLLEDTTIFLTADHGELLGEHGLVDHGYLYEQIIHVPLIIAGRGITHEEVKEPTTHLLIPKTILDLAGIDDAAIAHNIDSYANLESGIISSVVDVNRNMYSIRTKSWHFIGTFDLITGRHLFELYNIAEDPMEAVNVSDSQPELLRMFSERVTNFIQTNSSELESPARALSKAEEKELSRRLKELGYE